MYRSYADIDLSASYCATVEYGGRSWGRGAQDRLRRQGLRQDGKRFGAERLYQALKVTPLLCTPSQACMSDLTLAAAYLTNATAAVTSAASDCGGASAVCSSDIDVVASALRNATSDVSKAAQDCPKLKTICEADVADAAVAVAKAVKAAGHSIKDCLANCTAAY